MKYSKFITNRPASTKIANTKSVGTGDSTNTNSDKTSNANSNNNVVSKSMLMFENIITYLITYLVVSFILSGLNPKSIKSSQVIEYENSKIFKEIVKRPDTYINIIIEYNLKYLLTKQKCLFFINESTLGNTKNIQKHIQKHIQKQMEEIEFLLLGFIDILDIKLYLDAKLFNNSNSNGSGNSNGKGNVNYGRLGITKKDIKSYEKLDNIFNENIDTIYKLMIQLDKMCKRQESYSRKANGNNGNKKDDKIKVNKGTEVMIITKNSNDYDDLLGDEIDV